MAVRAVIFDWGGTLTPWHTVDHATLWRKVCAAHYAGPEHAGLPAAVLAAERELWRSAETQHRSAMIFQATDRAGISPGDAFWATYRQAWAPHTLIDPDAPGVLRWLRGRGIKVGVLSNTMWPRSWHQEVFRRDEVDGLIDGAVYSSEIEWTKPHPEAFRAALTAVGGPPPGDCVFVGDRPFDDIHGAKGAGLRAVLFGASEVSAFAGAEPDAVISRLSELQPLIEEW